MSERWTGGDPVSRVLVDLTADRDPMSGVPVTPGLVELAQRHGLVGLLAAETDAPLVRAVSSRIGARRAVMLGHLRRILERLDAEGIRAAVLKGPRVAQQYRKPGIRPFGDLDILVEETTLDRALDVLGSDEAAAGVPGRGPKADKRDIYFRDRAGISFNVDLHWDLFGYSQLRGRAYGATTEAWRKARPMRDSTLGPHWVLPEATEICFLATHAILDHRFRLILLRDLVEIAARKRDWEDVVETAGRWSLQAAAYVPLWLARHAVAADVPDDGLESLRRPSLVISYLERALPRLDLVRFDGHSVHPVNLASVLLADSVGHRLALSVRAPGAFPAWRRRVVSHKPVADSPRVLIVVNTDQRRGAEVFAERLSSGLTKIGWFVDAVSLTSIRGTTRANVTPLTDVRPGDASRLDIGIARALRRRIKSLPADVVLAIGPTLRYGVLATRGLDSRLYYVSIGEPGYWLRTWRSTVLNRMLLRATDRVLAVSERTRSELIELEPKIAGSTDVIHTGVPDDMFRLPGPQPHDPLHVVMIGSLSKEKNPLLALRAVAAMDRAVIRFVGDGPLAGALLREADILGVGDRVEISGSVGDVTPHLGWADVLILTSRTEGLPGAIIEAGAAAVPAISVDVGGVTEAVEHGVTGIVVAPGDLAALTDALQELADDPDRVTRMGMAARERVADLFTMERAVARYADVLADVRR